MDKTLKFDEEKRLILPVHKILPEAYSTIYKIQVAEIVDFLHFCFLCNILSKGNKTKPSSQFI